MLNSAQYAAKLQWDRPIDVVVNGFGIGVQRYVENGLTAIVQKYAPMIEAWMKENAPWTDRTGNARQSLHADINIVVGQMYEIIMTHGVDYGKWLELRWQGRYAIIQPALDHFARLVFADVKRLLHA